MHSYNSNLHGFRLYSVDQNFPLPLPCFYSEFISTTHQDYQLINSNFSDSIEELQISLRDISKTVAELYLSKLSNFLEWVELYSIESRYITLATHHNLPEEIINYYLNEHLIDKKGKGIESVTQHTSALRSYYTYLEATGFSNRKNLYIKPIFKEQARTNTSRRTSIKYLTPGVRRTLVHFAKSKRDAIFIRTAAECGLRSMENQGFVLNDFRVGRKTHKGFLSLFQEMDKDNEKLEFVFFLQGIYSKASRGKGGKSRDIFISRDLLLSIREYWAEERPYSDSNFLFLNDARNDKNPISKHRPSKVFKNIRKLVIEAQENGELGEHEQALENDHTYHCLRHSFGTDLFYDLAEEGQVMVDNVTTTSQIYLTVAAVLGHSAAGRHAPKTTKNYIRSCNIKKQFETQGKH